MQDLRVWVCSTLLVAGCVAPQFNFVDLGPARNVSPPPNAVVGPEATLRWIAGANSSNSTIFVCPTLACSGNAEWTGTVEGTELALPPNLAPGFHYWSVQAGIGNARAAGSEITRFYVAPQRQHGRILGVVPALADAELARWIHPDPGGATFFEIAGNFQAATSPQYVGYLGAPPDADFGRWASALVDFDGDQRLDGIVGLPNRGEVRFHESRAGMGAALPGEVSASTTGALGFGAVLLPLGDQNLDGFGDLLVGSLNASNALLIRGNELHSTNQTETLNLSNHDLTTLAVVGDLDSDGRPDLAQGAGSEPSAIPYLWLTAGSSVASATPSRLSAPIGYTKFAETMGLAGDFDGDGQLELPISAVTSGFGRILLYEVRDGSFPTVPSVEIPTFVSSEAPYVSSIGDANADGFDDLILLDLAAGELKLYTGSAAGLSSSESGRITLTTRPSGKFGVRPRLLFKGDTDAFDDFILEFDSLGSGTFDTGALVLGNPTASWPKGYRALP